MALFGVRVVADDATAGGGRRAVVRMLAVPLGFLFRDRGSPASCWGTGAGRRMTSSPGRRSSARGTRAARLRLLSGG